MRISPHIGISDTDFPSSEHSELVDRPVTESVTTWAGIDTDFPSDEHSELVDRPVTESVTARTEVIQTFPVANIQNLSTDRSRSR